MAVGERPEQLISFLPASSYVVQLIDVHLPLAVTASKPGGVTVTFASADALEDAGGMAELPLLATMRTVKPTLFVALPYVWERIQQQVIALSTGNSTLSKWLFRWATAKLAAENEGDAGGLSSDGPSAFLSSFVGSAVHWQVLQPVLAHVGLERCFDSSYSTGSSIKLQTVDFLASVGIKLCELYGCLECSGVVAASLVGLRKVGSCGMILPGTEVKLRHQPGRDKPGDAPAEKGSHRGTNHRATCYHQSQ
jgi:long-subunit acyl-CoA synthetase (AMP-forming)